MLYYKAMGTFTVICLGFAILLVCETLFSYIRRYLVLALTLRIETKLATHVFDKLLKLPMQLLRAHFHTGHIAHNITYLRRISGFLKGQLFGSVLDLGHASGVHPGDAPDQPDHDRHGVGGSARSSRCGCC